MGGLKTFRLEGCNAYLLWAGKEAVLIDPNWQAIEDYREFTAENGLKVRYVIDTHIHADHRSASHWIAAQMGGEIAMSAKTQSARPSRRLQDKEMLQWAGGTLKVVETPGHTPDAICLLWEADFVLGGVPRSIKSLFTGDTLLVGATGRTDFRGSSAGQLFDSLRRLEREVSPETLIFPGHDYSGVLFSRFATELALNTQLRLKDRAAFEQMKQEELIAQPAMELKDVIEFNLAKDPQAPASSDFGAHSKTACGVAMERPGMFSTLQVQKYRERIKKHGTDVRFLDVRERSEFSEGHIPGVENFPLSELPMRLEELKPSERIYVSCLSGRRSETAAQTLSYLGFTDVVNVSGGYQAWVQSGFEVQK
jgi:glyoxylase-like metal-dependent hydrolase (beta-lactamase superfamily II)/rhodanese-related sulfurtransferase